MNATLIKALVLLLMAGILFVVIALRFIKTKSRATLLQLAGIGCWLVVALAHVCEGLQWFPEMGWGREGTVGHYLDLGSVLLGTGLLVIGLMLHVVARRHH